MAKQRSQRKGRRGAAGPRPSEPARGADGSEVDAAARAAGDAAGPGQDGDQGGAAGEGAEAMAERVLTSGDPDALLAQMQKMTPRERVIFAEAVERAMRKRRLLLWGYLLAAVVMLVGVPLSLYLYGTRAPGEFGGWYFLIPFLSVGAVLFIFGRIARRL